jgi:hypothetical protein
MLDFGASLLTEPNLGTRLGAPAEMCASTESVLDPAIPTEYLDAASQSHVGKPHSAVRISS